MYRLGKLERGPGRLDCPKSYVHLVSIFSHRQCHVRTEAMWKCRGMKDGRSSCCAPCLAPVCVPHVSDIASPAPSPSPPPSPNLHLASSQVSNCAGLNRGHLSLPLAASGGCLGLSPPVSAPPGNIPILGMYFVHSQVHSTVRHGWCSVGPTNGLPDLVSCPLKSTPPIILSLPRCLTAMCSPFLDFQSRVRRTKNGPDFRRGAALRSLQGSQPPFTMPPHWYTSGCQN